MKIIYDESFDSINSITSTNSVFEIFPNVFNDARGYFTEVFKQNNADSWVKDFSWVKQINRSSSQSYTIRGCHTQKAPYCQGKLVEALNEKIYDIITDARPESKTFGTSKIFILDPIKQNKLWVPRGFLHAFVVPKCENDALFQYFCDNIYDKDSEIGINPLTLLPVVSEKYKNEAKDYNSTYINDYNELYDILHGSKMSISDKDINNLDYEMWMAKIKSEYESTGKSWWN